MTKAELTQDKTGKWLVRDPRTGEYVELRGANSMKPSDFPLKKGIDLTKPIAAQVRSRTGSQSKTR